MKIIGIPLAILLFTLGCRNKADDEIWLIPENYRGWLVIIPDREEGIKKKHEGKKLVFEFPESGVLKTKFSLPSGWHSKDYFVDQDGVRTRIRRIHDKEEIETLSEGEPYIYGGYTSFPSPFPYEMYYAEIMLEKDKLSIQDFSESDEHVLEYAKKNNEI